MTQRQLADHLQVDQGTISRWERGVDTPRPSRVAELQNLLLRDRSRRALNRSVAFVRQDYLPSALLDSRLRLVELSASARRHYIERGTDPASLIGESMDRHFSRSGEPEFRQKVEESGLLDEGCLLFRFARNFRGRGHLTVYEPIFEDRELIGVLNYVTHYFPLSDHSSKTIELIEAVHVDDLDHPMVLHSGAGADEVLRAIGREA